MPDPDPPLSVSPKLVNAQCFCLNAQRAARRMARLYDDAFRPFGLSHGQFSALMLVAGMQPISVGRLAVELVMDRTTVTAALKPLERRGLIDTRSNQSDLRQRLLSVSTAGMAVLGQAARAWQEIQASVAGHGPGTRVRSELKRLSTTPPRQSRHGPNSRETE